jgi:large-conductance mechanosensitive channel
MILIRFFLISLIVYLIVRSFMRFGKDSESEKQQEHNNGNDIKKVSKSIGEYVDFEEIKKNNP